MKRPNKRLSILKRLVVEDHKKAVDLIIEFRREVGRAHDMGHSNDVVCELCYLMRRAKDFEKSGAFYFEP